MHSVLQNNYPRSGIYDQTSRGSPYEPPRANTFDQSRTSTFDQQSRASPYDNQQQSRSSTYEQQSPPGSYYRHSQSPATGSDALPSPQYGSAHQPFPQCYSAGSASTPVSLPSQASDQGSILVSQASVPTQLSTQLSTQLPTPGSISSHVDSFAQSRPPTTPSYYSTSSVSSVSHQPGYPSYQPHTSPTTPASSNGPPRTMALQHPGMAPPSFHQQQRYYPHNIPAMAPMTGPIMSNLGSPGHQMSLVSGMGVSPYGHLPRAMYGHPHGHGGQPSPQPDRPFKCDQCPQSFNRNHDLKRHKRIHLAVKPFPCTFCDKSFSRKDALKVSKIGHDARSVVANRFNSATAWSRVAAPTRMETQTRTARIIDLHQSRSRFWVIPRGGRSARRKVTTKMYINSVSLLWT